MFQITNKLLDRFWSKVNKFAPNGCWEWTGSKFGKGYGHLGIEYMMYQSHRVSWMLKYGEIPNDLNVCHKCDNPSCVNPDHLFLGTQSDNMKDMVRKGRKRGSAHKGEKHHYSKITNADTEEIKRLYSTGEYYQREIGKLYNLDQSEVSRIISGERFSL